MNDYQTLPGVRWSVLKSALVSPVQLRHRMDAGRKDTDSLRTGRISDLAILEPDVYEAQRVPVPAEFVTGAGKLSEAKKATEWRQTLPHDALLVTEQEHAVALGQCAAILAHPVASQWLQLTDHAKSAFFWDEDGIACKAEADAVAPSLGLLWDLKTITAGSDGLTVRQCLSHIATYCYHGQLAWYARGLAKGRPHLRITGRGWVFVAKAAPFDVVCIWADDDMVQEGDAIAQEALDVYRTAQDTGTWTGCAPGVVSGHLPWSRYRDAGSVDDLGLTGMEDA